MPKQTLHICLKNREIFWSENLDLCGVSLLGTLKNSQVKVYYNQQASLALCEEHLLSQSGEALLELIGAFFPRFPTDFSGLHLGELEGLGELQVPPFWGKGLEDEFENEWVFYGGTFNPWHRGHQACLDLMPKDKTLVIVPDRSPWKNNEANKTRQELLALAHWSYEQGHVLYPGFLNAKKPNPTVSWLPKIKGKKSLLIGADNFFNIHKWQDYRELLGSLECLYVAPRKFEESDQLQEGRQISHMDELGVKVIFLEHHDYEELSSSVIRAKKKALK